jgi:hypothetical protein
MGDSEAVEGVCMRVSMDQGGNREREDVPSLRGRLSGPAMVRVTDMRLGNANEDEVKRRTVEST